MGYWLKMGVRGRSWDSGDSSNTLSFLRIAGTFKVAADALIVFEFFGAVEKGFLAKSPGICVKGEEMLTLHCRLTLC